MRSGIEVELKMPDPAKLFQYLDVKKFCHDSNFFAALLNINKLKDNLIILSQLSMGIKETLKKTAVDFDTI